MIEPTLTIAATCLVGLCVVAFALLRGWQGWLEYKREELARTACDKARTPAPREGAARIELADMKERIKKLEAIASGVEL